MTRRPILTLVLSLALSTVGFLTLLNVYGPDIQTLAAFIAGMVVVLGTRKAADSIDTLTRQRRQASKPRGQQVFVEPSSPLGHRPVS